MFFKLCVDAHLKTYTNQNVIFLSLVFISDNLSKYNLCVLNRITQIKHMAVGSNFESKVDAKRADTRC